MGKLTEFDVILKDPNAVYITGANVEGYVTLDLSDVMKMRGKNSPISFVIRCIPFKRRQSWILYSSLLLYPTSRNQDIRKQYRLRAETVKRII